MYLVIVTAEWASVYCSAVGVRMSDTRSFESDLFNRVNKRTERCVEESVRAVLESTDRLIELTVAFWTYLTYNEPKTADISIAEILQIKVFEIFAT